MSVARKVRDIARAEKMAAMYRQGVTLQKIGDQFKVTRERVRQVLRTVGIDASDGGKALMMRIIRENASPKISVYAARLGLTQEAYELARDSGLLMAYRNQKSSADARGIKWSLTFPQWLAVWQASGKLDLRGQGADRYCMSRINDTGGYEIGSVHIQTNRENGREAVDKWKGRTKPIAGVFCLYPGTERPWIAKVGDKQVGRFASMEEAGAARDAYMADNGVLPRGLGRGKGWTYRTNRCTALPYACQVAGTKTTYHATAEEARAEYLRRCAEILAARSAAKALGRRMTSLDGRSVDSGAIASPAGSDGVGGFLSVCGAHGAATVHPLESVVIHRSEVGKFTA